MRGQKDHLSILCSLSCSWDLSGSVLRHLSSDDHFYPTDLSFYVLYFQIALSTSLCFINQHLKILARGSGHPFHESLGLIPRFFPVLLFPCYVLQYSFPVFTSLIYCFISKAAMKIIRGTKLTCLPFHSGMMISTVCLCWKKNKEPDLNRKRGNNLTLWNSVHLSLWVYCSGFIFLVQILALCCSLEQHNCFSSKLFCLVQIWAWSCRW